MKNTHELIPRLKVSPRVSYISEFELRSSKFPPWEVYKQMEKSILDGIAGIACGKCRHAKMSVQEDIATGGRLLAASCALGTSAVCPDQIDFSAIIGKMGGVTAINNRILGGMSDSTAEHELSGANPSYAVFDEMTEYNGDARAEFFKKNYFNGEFNQNGEAIVRTSNDEPQTNNEDVW